MHRRKDTDAESHREWLKARKKTTIVFVIESLLVGMDFSLTFLTLWLYINTLVKPKTPRVYYSIISAAFLTASLTISGIVGRVVDKTRHVRATFFIINTIVIIGNLIYAIPFSPWTLVVGRLLSGFGGPLRSVIAGELARCYHPDRLSKVVSAMGMSYSFGFVLGPAFNFAFKDVSFSLGEWKVTFVNMPGIYMSVLFLIVNFLSIFLLYDLSKIYDLKKETVEKDLMNGLLHKANQRTIDKREQLVNEEPNKTIDPTLICNDITENISIRNNSLDNVGLDKLSIANLVSLDRDANSNFENKQRKNLSIKTNGICAQYKSITNYGSNNSQSNGKNGYYILLTKESNDDYEAEPLVPTIDYIPSVSSTLRKLFSRIDTTLILCLAFFESYFAVSFDMWIPMLVMETMNWSVTALNWIIIGVGVSCTVPCLVLAFVTISDEKMYAMAMGCILSLALMESVFIILSRYNSNQIFDYIAWSIFCLLYAFLVVMEEVFLVSCLAKMVNSSIQTFADSIRLTMYRLGALVALMTSALIFQWIEIVGCVHIAIIFTGFTIMLVRREGFKNPRIIIR